MNRHFLVGTATLLAMLFCTSTETNAANFLFGKKKKEN